MKDIGKCEPGEHQPVMMNPERNIPVKRGKVIWWGGVCVLICKIVNIRQTCRSNYTQIILRTPPPRKGLLVMKWKRNIPF